ncbi:hypothetical protein IFM89_031798 [Coptis chinensis]|uniref:Pectinesterase n=1 Tax=Coptis chinensis TaxID=261450 RepID=A0A835HR05_9MAGN|nr:hypothetical protein IFM89_031798 [Coptis chinensis]
MARSSWPAWCCRRSRASSYELDLAIKCCLNQGEYVGMLRKGATEDPSTAQKDDSSTAAPGAVANGKVESKSRLKPSTFHAEVGLVLKVSLNGHDAKFTSIQKAVDAVPPNCRSKTLITIGPGTYREKVIVDRTKSNVIFQGQGYQTTIIAWNDTALSAKGTTSSHTVGIFASNFTAYDISFKNTAPPPDGVRKGAQAVAVNIEADQAAFYRCGFYGIQDTVLDNRGKHYYKDCFIEGATDFIFGDARSLFEGCTLNLISSDHRGMITAQARESLDSNTGFSFVNCKIIGKGNAWLGRAYRAYATVVFINTNMANIIAMDGWNDMGKPTYHRTVFFGEYGCSGPGANRSKRVSYSKQLSLAEARPFMSISFIEGDKWLPVHT